MKHYINSCLEPAYNLAFEETLLKSNELSGQIIMGLWKNAPSVIIGRNQVAEQEVDLEFTQSRGIPVVRRSTGGGAVYHDTGNLNFSFFFPLETVGTSPQAGYERVFMSVQPFFETLGLKIEKSPTNDLWYKGRKFSGMAQRVHGKRVLVHGTILYDVDFKTLAQALNVAGGKFNQKHGVASRHAEVINLKPYLPQISDIQTLIQRWIDYWQRNLHSAEWVPQSGFIEEVKKNYESCFGFVKPDTRG